MKAKEYLIRNNEDFRINYSKHKDFIEACSQWMEDYAKVREIEVKRNISSQEYQIRLQTLEDLKETIRGVNPEYIGEAIDEEISIIKHGH